MIFILGTHFQMYSLSKVLSPFLVSIFHFAKLCIQCTSKVTFYIVFQEEIMYGRMNTETSMNFLVDIHLIRNFKVNNQITFLFQLLLFSEWRSAHICLLWGDITLNLDCNTKTVGRDPVSNVHHSAVAIWSVWQGLWVMATGLAVWIWERPKWVTFTLFHLCPREKSTK